MARQPGTSALITEITASLVKSAVWPDRAYINLDGSHHRTKLVQPTPCYLQANKHD